MPFLADIGHYPNVLDQTLTILAPCRKFIRSVKRNQEMIRQNNLIKGRIIYCEQNPNEQLELESFSFFGMKVLYSISNWKLMPA